MLRPMLRLFGHVNLFFFLQKYTKIHNFVTRNKISLFLLGAKSSQSRPSVCSQETSLTVLPPEPDLEAGGPARTSTVLEAAATSSSETVSAEADRVTPESSANPSKNGSTRKSGKKTAVKPEKVTISRGATPRTPRTVNLAATATAHPLEIDNPAFSVHPAEISAAESEAQSAITTDNSQDRKTESDPVTCKSPR
jgi:hypothetical protein